eukprot:TRINITY_DN27401_c0_g1_i1.p1 TRINITY_DN27401_c0_g1~~TRINITY_DN27401_c0_g1_i1.p1  ORF type:complete len:325 (+),score=66.62 TRINITY_DN27401_c0_g1_i1:83-976(+)
MTHQLYKKWTNFYSSVVSPITSTRFMEKGQLTPEEFVETGDQLVAKCPTWKWRGCDDDKKDVHKTMPKDKRYLVMTGARCEKRASEMNCDGGEEEVEGGWTNTFTEMQCGQDAAEMVDASAPSATKAEDSDSDSAPDMDMNMDGGGVIEDEEDPSAVVSSAVVLARNYDIHILYDNYHYTPRVYLQGYNENGERLTNKEMFEDIYKDYMDKTATIETHPYTDAPMVSIHPCRHAETMKSMIERLRYAYESKLVESGADENDLPPFGVNPDKALFIFLKFISSVIPTINYDYTTTVEL